MNYLLVFLFILPTSIIIIWTALASGMISVLDRSIEKWAQVGDFFGGTLNPIFAYLALIALLYTIKLQLEALKMSKEELEATRKELTESRIAQQEQSESLKLQNKATQLQIFENTFFILLKELNIIISSLLLENKLEKKINLWISSVNNRESLKNRVEIENIEEIKNFVTLLYQLLKFVDKSLIEEKMMYTNIIRVYIPDNALYLLAIYCEVLEYLDYKNYLEKYEFFNEINYNNDNIIYFISILKEYDIRIFGTNKKVIDLIINDDGQYMKRFGEVQI